MHSFVQRFHNKIKGIKRASSRQGRFVARDDPRGAFRFPILHRGSKKSGKVWRTPSCGAGMRMRRPKRYTRVCVRAGNPQMRRNRRRFFERNAPRMFHTPVILTRHHFLAFHNGF